MNESNIVLIRLTLKLKHISTEKKAKSNHRSKKSQHKLPYREIKRINIKNQHRSDGKFRNNKLREHNKK